MSDPIIKFTRGVPPVESFPKDKLSECAVNVLSEQADLVLQYGNSYGYAPLRQLIAQEKGISEERVILSQGSLQMVDLFTRMNVKPDDPVYVEEPTYDRTLTILHRSGANIVSFPFQSDGVDVDAIANRLKNGERPVFIYIIPDFQNPSGMVMSVEKRIQLAQLAQKYNFWILEDIPYRKLRYRGQDLPSLFDLAPDRVMQLSSYSKLICPGLRVGFIITTEAIAKPMAKFTGDTYINSSYLNQAIVYDFVHRGWFDENLAFLKNLYRTRLDSMLSALDSNFQDIATWFKPDGGFFVGMTLQKKIPADQLLKLTAQANLELTDGRGFFTSGGDSFIRLPFCALTPEEIQTGITRLNKVIRKFV